MVPQSRFDRKSAGILSFGWVSDLFGRLLDVFGWLSDVSGRSSDGFWLSGTVFRYRGRLLAIANGVSPHPYPFFFLFFFWGAKRPKKKYMKQKLAHGGKVRLFERYGSGQGENGHRRRTERTLKKENTKTWSDD